MRYIAADAPITFGEIVIVKIERGISSLGNEFSFSIILRGTVVGSDD